MHQRRHSRRGAARSCYTALYRSANEHTTAAKAVKQIQHQLLAFQTIGTIIARMR